MSPASLILVVVIEALSFKRMVWLWAGVPTARNPANTRPATTMPTLSSFSSDIIFIVPLQVSVPCLPGKHRRTGSPVSSLKTCNARQLTRERERTEDYDSEHSLEYELEWRSCHVRTR